MLTLANMTELRYERSLIKTRMLSSYSYVGISNITLYTGSML